MIDEFKAGGGKHMGIVGAGEPFHPRNKTDLYKVLDHAKENNLWTTIFTTADLITDKDLDMLDQYPRITLQVKYNSSYPEVQDKIVNNPGYTHRRVVSLEKMFERGYNDGSRLGVVTSILKENLQEMPAILRMARQKNLIFDADTLISRGRGSTCRQNPLDEEIRSCIAKLRKVDQGFDNYWEIHGTYIASPPCTRFSKHIYIDKTGDAHPCVSSCGVILGNIKEQSLQDLWDHPAMKIIRAHAYTGRCTTCKNFQEKKCFSCLGRACENVTTDYIQRHRHIQTIGCTNYKAGTRKE